MFEKSKGRARVVLGVALLLAAFAYQPAAASHELKVKAKVPSSARAGKDLTLRVRVYSSCFERAVDARVAGTAASVQATRSCGELEPTVIWRYGGKPLRSKTLKPDETVRPYVWTVRLPVRDVGGGRLKVRVKVAQQLCGAEARAYVPIGCVAVPGANQWQCHYQRARTRWHRVSIVP